MSASVCLAASTLGLPRAGGHAWVYLNWALGLRALGCRVSWLEVGEGVPPDEREDRAGELRRNLEPFGLAWAVTLDPAAAAEADLLLDFGGKLPDHEAARFRRTAMIDIDPGLTQLWASASGLPRRDLYFTIGERVPDCGVEWHPTLPAVHLPEWPVAPGGEAYTTVSSWWGWWESAGGESFDNQKRASFLEYRDLPRRVPVALELALALWGREDEDGMEEAGWRVREAFEVAPTPSAYRAYVEGSRGEFSCAKPSCMKLANAWISDRTLCYLASGKPAVVQHTGPSRLLPDREGLLRFRTLEEAVQLLEEAEADYDRHSRAARELAGRFDAAGVAARLLERALP